MELKEKINLILESFYLARFSFSAYNVMQVLREDGLVCEKHEVYPVFSECMEEVKYQYSSEIKTGENGNRYVLFTFIRPFSRNITTDSPINANVVTSAPNGKIAVKDSNGNLIKEVNPSGYYLNKPSNTVVTLPNGKTYPFVPNSVPNPVTFNNPVAFKNVVVKSYPATVRSEGRVTIPKEALDHAGIKNPVIVQSGNYVTIVSVGSPYNGEKLAFYRETSGSIRFRFVGKKSGDQVLIESSKTGVIDIQ